MDTYYEQSVAAKDTKGKNVLYALCWVLVAVLLIAAVAFAAGVIANDPSALRINWLNLIGLVICLALAFVVFRRKDGLRMEYDYLLDSDTLEICGIYNKQRRRRLVNIEIGHLKSMGAAEGGRYEALKNQRGVKLLSCYGEKASHYLYYTEKNVNCIALMELDENLERLVRRQLPVGAWQGREGE